MKLKPYIDSEATVIGVRFGEEGRVKGRLGSLMMRWGQKVFFMGSGIDDVERELFTPNMGDDAVRDHAYHNAGKATTEFQSKTWPVGTVITFKYRELTEDGLPKDPRLQRKRVEE